MIFGKKLYTERKKKNMSSEMVAKVCDVSRSYITLIENGRRLPGRKTIPLIAQALDVETHKVIDWYLEDIREKFQDEILP